MVVITKDLFVQAGACIVDNQLIRCALEATACDDPKDFISSRELMVTPDSPRVRVGESCLTETYTIPLGRCINDGVCASTATSCTSEDDFEPNDSECTVRYQGQRLPAMYGGCQDTYTSGKTDIMCLWDRSDSCSDNTPGRDEVWLETVNVEALNDNPCTCESVYTGACLDNNDEYYCAVSEHACDQESTFVSPRNVPLIVRCRLCEEWTETPTQTPSPSALRVTSTPTSTPTFTPTAPPFSLAPSALEGKDDSILAGGGLSNNTALIAIVVAGSVVVLLVVAIVLLVYRFLSSKAHSSLYPTDEAGKGGADSENSTILPEESFDWQGNPSRTSP